VSPRIKIGALLWTQGTDWPSFLEAARAVDRAGFDSIWVSDHLLSPTGPSSGPIFEGWTVISALGALLGRTQVGHIVGSNTFRHPGLVAKMAATLDHITDGRAVLGLGAGWLEIEHRAHGLAFESSPGQRIDRLADSVRIIRDLLDGRTVHTTGRFYSLDGAAHSPLPLQGRVPILIGGEGRVKTLRLVAEAADMWNARGSVDELAELDAILREHCREVGRDPDAIERTTVRWIVIRDDPVAAARDLDAFNRRHGITRFDPKITAIGTPADVAEALRPVVDIGFRHLVASLRSPWDHETIARLPDIRLRLEEGAGA
jgi:alkanesulfonate monooxygenase SsuD/methylene tetrahydromethanopterin reductase-like flavin-dependent oxidoreductase (luciferase family)